jgi:CBS domain-containing protein
LLAIKEDLEMLISDVMTRDVDVISPGTTLSEAARKMRDRDVGSLPVAENDRLVGMVTDRDIVVKGIAADRDAGRTTASEVMSPKMLYCFDDQSLEDVLANMGDVQVRRLPVVDREKKLVGIVSIGDLAKQGSATKTGEALKDISRMQPLPRQMPPPR